MGGRAYTADLDGVPVDLGCSWIHQPIGNPMTRFATRSGVGRAWANVELDALLIRFYDGYLHRELNVWEKGLALAHGLNFAQNESVAIGRRLGAGASVRDGAQVYLDRWRLRGSARRQAEFAIRLLSEFVDGEDWGNLSLSGGSWGGKTSPYVGFGQGDFPRGGYRRLVTAMRGPEEVLLGHRVDAVEVGRSGVTVRATANDRWVVLQGSHAVVTVPLGVLKQGSIAFTPELPEAKRAAIAHVGFGVVEKVVMMFDRPLWSGRRHTHALHLSGHAPLEFPWFVDLHRILRVPGLMVFSGGGFARALDRLPAADAMELARARLREMLGFDVPQPRAYAVTNWLSDPASLGSYSNIPVGRSTADLDVLAQPVAGRLLFAGEATNRVRHSVADGALSSGVREAKRLLRRPAVMLSSG